MREVAFGMGPAALGSSAEPLRERFAQLGGAALGAEVHVIPAATYKRLVQRMREGTVQVAWLPPAVSILVSESLSARRVVASERSAERHFHGALFTRAGSGYVRAEDMRDVSVAWVDAASCSGYLFPRFALVERGLHPNRCFSTEVVLGSHAAVAHAVVAGEIDVGATYVNLDARGETAGAGWTDLGYEGKVRTLLTTRSIPSDVVCAIRQVPMELERDLAEALQALHEQEEGAEVLAGLLHAERFGPVRERDYEVVRSALNVAHLPLMPKR